ncbi:hypothetical protein AB0H07_34420 [Streptomyces sp. NPDC021354]|uniref:hypothetical protein n=1 Tax=Streptomyces sp. NPDC021354 TaxID=3154793 RepID=UPI0034060352
MSEVRVAFTRGVEFDELVEHARDQGWRAETPSGYPVPATDPLEADAYVFLWRFGVDGIARFVDDEVTEVQFIQLDGEGAHTTATILAEKFSTVSYADCLNLLNGQISTDEREKALEMIGLIAPRDYASGVHEAILGGLESDSSVIRTAAISAILQLSWVEFRSALRHVVDSDPDPNNRAYASNVLHALPPV